MAKLAFFFAQIFVASCLLAFVTPFPTGDDTLDALNEDLDAWLESLYKIYQHANPDHSQEQQLQHQSQEQKFPQQQEQELTQSTTQEPDSENQSEEQLPTQNITQEQQDSQNLSQEHQLTHNLTPKKVNNVMNLLAKLKPEHFNKELLKKLKECLEDDSKEDEKHKSQETDDSKDDSSEETTTTIQTPTSTTQGTSTTTEETTTTTTTTESTTTETTPPVPFCYGYKPYDLDISYYLQFDGVNWSKKPCPYGYGFDYSACACSIKLYKTTTTIQTPTSTTQGTSTTTEETTTTTTTTESTTTETTPPVPFCYGYKPYDLDISYYLQFDGVNWSKKPCPYGYGFDYSACACSIKLYTPKSTTTTTPESTTTTTPEATTPVTTPEATTTTTTTTQKTSTVKPSLELCNDCVILHGVGYAPFPGHCDAYVQCRFFGDVPTAINIRKCSAGYYWNQDKLTCDFEENVKCTPVNNCPNHKAIFGDWGAYLIFNGQNWLRETCPSSTTYNSITCGCTDKHNDDDDDSHENCTDKKAISGDKTAFLQVTGNGWVRMPCPASVGYNEQTCSCTDKLDTDDSDNGCPDKKFIPGDKFGYLQFNGVAWIRQPCPATLVYNIDTCVCTYDDNNKDDSDSKDGDVCKSVLSLTFDNNDATDSSINEFWVNNTGVTFNDGKAYFNGKSRLTIPGLSNFEFGSTVYIFIKYRHSSASSQQTLIANGDCQVRQSLAVCSGKESVDFYAETKEQLSLAKVTVPADIGLWQNVVYALDKDDLQGSVGANKVSQPIKGALDRRQRGLVIGGGGNCDNFHGIIDEIQVFLCKPSF